MEKYRKNEIHWSTPPKVREKPMIKKKIVAFIEDNRAQAGGIIMFVLAFFIIGFIYIILGGLENRYVIANNLLLTNPAIPYSQDHRDAMDSLFRFWWAIPIIATVILIIYAVKNALQDRSEPAY